MGFKNYRYANGQKIKSTKNYFSFCFLTFIIISRINLLYSTYLFTYVNICTPTESTCYTVPIYLPMSTFVPPQNQPVIQYLSIYLCQLLYPHRINLLYSTYLFTYVNIYTPTESTCYTVPIYLPMSTFVPPQNQPVIQYLSIYLCQHLYPHRINLLYSTYLFTYVNICTPTESTCNTVPIYLPMSTFVPPQNQPVIQYLSIYLCQHLYPCRINLLYSTYLFTYVNICTPTESTCYTVPIYLPMSTFVPLQNQPVIQYLSIYLCQHLYPHRINLLYSTYLFTYVNICTPTESTCYTVPIYLPMSTFVSLQNQPVIQYLSIYLCQHLYPHRINLLYSTYLFTYVNICTPTESTCYTVPIYLPMSTFVPPQNQVVIQYLSIYLCQHLYPYRINLLYSTYLFTYVNICVLYILMFLSI